MTLLTEYNGCAGSVDLRFAAPLFSLQHLSSLHTGQQCVANQPIHILQPGAPRLVQWCSTPTVETCGLHETALLLAGALVSSRPAEDGCVSLASALKRDDLGSVRLEGDCAGVYASAGRVVMVKTRTSNETIFYKKTGSHLSWSTDPRDLLDSQHALNRAALAACCRGEDAFVFRGLSWVRAGHGVVITKDQVDTFPLESDTLPSFPAGLRLSDWARLAYNVLLDATRHLAKSGEPVGILLSGGINSAALAAALVENGAEVFAYHLWHEHPAANEAAFAEDVCRCLDIPLRCVRTTTGADYLQRRWRCAHPYGHPGYRWMEQVAEQMAHDGVHLLATGRYADAAFGPGERYGLADILATPLPLREKGRMAFHLLSTNWTLLDLLRSSHPAHSLIDTTTLSKAERRTLAPRRADFVVAQPDDAASAYLRYSDFAGESSLDFSPQDLAVEQVWHRHGIRVFHPYQAASVQALSAHLPAAYRLLPYQGQKITKPVLREAFAHHLPASVLRRLHGSWPSVPGQEFCLEHQPWLMSWLTNASAHVIQMGLIDETKMRATLGDPRALRANYHSVLATAMVEIFLDQFQSAGRE